MPFSFSKREQALLKIVSGCKWPRYSSRFSFREDRFWVSLGPTGVPRPPSHRAAGPRERARGWVTGWLGGPRAPRADQARGLPSRGEAGRPGRVNALGTGAAPRVRGGSDNGLVAERGAQAPCLQGAWSPGYLMPSFASRSLAPSLIVVRTGLASTSSTAPSTGLQANAPKRSTPSTL